MKFDIITIFPDIFGSYFSESILKRAQEKKIIQIDVHNLRDFVEGDRHQKVDDTPCGGGAGMVMKVQPIFTCVEALKTASEKKKTRVILFSAKGKRYTQKDAVRLSKYENLVLICGRYEGVDERVAKHIADEEISIGEFVLTGGEIPAMVIVDSVARLLPGVLGNAESAIYESHSKEGYLEHQQYTKPEEFSVLDNKTGKRRIWKVPEVLLSGNHKEIEKWREQN